MPYSDMFKRKMVQKMTGPDAISATALAKQVDVPQTTLSKWLRKAGIEPPFGYPKNSDDAVKMRPPVTGKSPKDWSPEEKLKAVLESAQLTDEQLGAYLRQKGLHETHLQQWRIQMLHGLAKRASAPKSKGAAAQTKKIRDLEKELRRKDKALAETAALLVLKKKSSKSGGRGRRHSRQERQMILDLIDEAVAGGARLQDLKMYSSFDRKKGRFGLGPIRDELKALVLWILEDGGHSDAPYPFALPHLDFAKRCQRVDERIEQWIGRPRKATETRAIESPSTPRKTT